MGCGRRKAATKEPARRAEVKRTQQRAELGLKLALKSTAQNNQSTLNFEP